MSPSATLGPAATLSRDPLLQPLQIKHLRLRNRIMSTSHASTHDVGGMPLEKYQRYHEEKAKGGLALTMFGGSSMVSKDSSWVGGQVAAGGYHRQLGRIHELCGARADAGCYGRRPSH